MVTAPVLPLKVPGEPPPVPRVNEPLKCSVPVPPFMIPEAATVLALVTVAPPLPTVKVPPGTSSVLCNADVPEPRVNVPEPTETAPCNVTFPLPALNAPPQTV